eukprot:847265-Amphidinium_carterae.1
MELLGHGCCRWNRARLFHELELLADKNLPTRPPPSIRGNMSRFFVEKWTQTGWLTGRRCK